MGSAGPAHPEGARPIGSAMAAPVKDREVLQRLSFLFQAAHWVLPHSPALARFYCSIQRGTARRLVLRLSPSVKRVVCRRCCSLLLPGAGGCLRLRGRGQPRTVLRCRSCGRHRRYLCREPPILETPPLETPTLEPPPLEQAPAPGDPQG
ncbi:ribonuclease P protein subunit p21 isoform X2 [Strigops habroptila]|uniref:ribonuclease P protein subunit p21 isoform X2 n=1 Tax=Strigops habroptila TaxID=2489341 RepID=UPI0011CF9692|nr:ribonuclease P protein subunit p21 isoform X2 [Strigops habroptila]